MRGFREGDLVAKAKTLSHADWCLRAASREENRPVLTALNISPTELCATDGHRLHVAGRNGHDDGLIVGTWSKTPGQQIIGKFPTWEQVFSPASCTRVLDAAGVIPILDAAIAYAKARHSVSPIVTLPLTAEGEDKSVAVNAQYLKDVLAGRDGDRVRYQASSLTTPLTWFVVGLIRVAALMPIRTPNAGVPDPRFDLGEFVHNDEAPRSDG